MARKKKNQRGIEESNRMEGKTAENKRPEKNKERKEERSKERIRKKGREKRWMTRELQKDRKNGEKCYRISRNLWQILHLHSTTDGREKGLIIEK